MQLSNLKSRALDGLRPEKRTLRFFDRFLGFSVETTSRTCLLINAVSSGVLVAKHGASCEQVMSVPGDHFTGRGKKKKMEFCRFSPNSRVCQFLTIQFVLIRSLMSFSMVGSEWTLWRCGRATEVRELAASGDTSFLLKRHQWP